jgi:hypothetical protein
MQAAMSSHGSKRFPQHHGYGEVRPSRYFALYLAQASWFALGFWLFRTAFWPSSCTPDDAWEVIACSIRLPESGGWTEAALLTWIWSTPILVGLEISRRLVKSEG